MAYFDDDFFHFFRELEKNNTKAWFQEHKKRYEKSIKKPFNDLVSDLILKINALNPRVQIEPLDAIFRINRDVRFSNDKSPYKTNVSALISEKGKKDKSIPGIYFTLSTSGITMYGGTHLQDKALLLKVRTFIAKNSQELDKALNDPVFKKTFGEITGEKHKRLAPPFDQLMEKQPLIANKSFLYSASLPKDAITDEMLTDKIVFYYKASHPVREYLYNAITN
ncbi:DUF2461 domain-containing protein [Fulvivirgaceae bacterium BMA12]|uniref:DUF2461 domain-containing protein n=1 Tax=Agaribacillus aureus TaxID=3051825 RepID=A0ABT8L3A9_9BACT|nr:DUF2461 domain-containing protein [Fulvivirgaceae bacterium BMA12]